MAARGLKTKIAFNVALLLLLSALVTDILVIVVVQNVMVRESIRRFEAFARINGSIYLDADPGGQDRTAAADLLGRLREGLWPGGFFSLWDPDGRKLLVHPKEDDFAGFTVEKIQKAMGRESAHVEKAGLVWSAFWWRAESIFVYQPIRKDHRLLGLAVAHMPLTPIYELLSGYNKPIFLYILINSAVLTLVGLYRIFRLYLRPIDRIVRQADEFQDDADLLFAFRQEDNELNRLSISLNRMLSRISSDKKKLRSTVTSLEQANVELQNAQKEILRAEKLASVGRLAAGIAHEIGNPIGIVLGYLDMLKEPDLDNDDKVDFLQRTEKEIQRINTVIRQLLDLARPHSDSTRQIHVHEVLTDIAEVMRLQPILKEIPIALDLRGDHDEIIGDPDQLRQVFLNLILNAADAIRGKASSGDGMIRIATRIVQGDASSGTPRLQIRFEDNGIGMDPEQLSNIFDPFYTTKEPGKGTGLGLSVSYMIIEGAGGSLAAESPGKDGAVFTIHLPLAPARAGSGGQERQLHSEGDPHG